MFRYTWSQLSILLKSVLDFKLCIKISNQYSDYFKVLKGVWQGCPLSLILFKKFNNEIFKSWKKYRIKVGIESSCGPLLANEIVLCAFSRN